MKPLKVIIAGGRDFDDYSLLVRSCDKILAPYIEDNYPIEVVSGTADGADKLGEQYARKHKFKLKRMPANWELFGKAAGSIRNGEMADYAKTDSCLGVLIAFHDGKSKGTADMIRQAKRDKLIVRVIHY